MLALATLVVSSLLAMPLVIWLAVSADAREAGLDAPAATTLAVGVTIAALYTVGSLAVLARPTLAVVLFLCAAALGVSFGQDDGTDGLAALLFLFAAALGLFVGYEDGRDGLAIYGVLALPLTLASAACARRRAQLRVVARRDG